MASRAYPTVLAAVAIAAGLLLGAVAVGRSVRQASARAAEPTSLASPPSPGRVEQRTFYSAALGRTMPYSLYLPPGYSAAPRAARYPVVYLLHGRGDSHTSWLGYGVVAEANELIESGRIPPLLIVMPEGEVGFWTDHVNEGPRWGTYVADDLVAEIDASLPTIAERGARAIGGISMGGFGALQLAMHYQSTFSVVGAHGVALRTRESAPAFLGADEAFAARDPVALYARHIEAARGFQLWLDIGADDPWLPAAARFHAQLLREAVPHHWTVSPGGHDGDYWRAHMGDYLTYYGQALATRAPAAASASPALSAAQAGH